MKALILQEELAYQRVFGWIVETHMVGPAILRWGTEEQKKKYLPAIANGEIETCLGYTEPDAGSDLASLQTRADEKGDYFLLNGRKTFTSMANIKTHMWLMARTDVNVPKHRGISAFMLDMKTPGITCMPFEDIMGRFEFNDVYFDNVQVLKDCMIGPKNGGWYVMQDALNEERRCFGAGINNVAICRRYLDYLIDYSRAHNLLNDLVVRNSLAQLAIEVGQVFAYVSTWEAIQTTIAVRATSLGRIFNAELMQRVSNTAMDILGLYGQLSPDSEQAPWSGEIHNFYLDAPSETIGAGTTEVMRNTIATVILGLPRAT